VYVVRRGWHVEVGLAVGDLQPPLLPVAAAFPGSRYLLFGFGNRRYLLHGNLGNSLAAPWPGPGAVMVTSLDRAHPEDVFGNDNVVRLPLTPQQMGELQSFIGRTFATRDGALMPIAPGPHAGSAYYEAVPRYSALHTCNTWAAQALRSAKLPVRTFGVQFAWQIWSQVRRLASVDVSSARRTTPWRVAAAILFALNRRVLDVQPLLEPRVNRGDRLAMRGAGG